MNAGTQQQLMLLCRHSTSEKVRVLCINLVNNLTSVLVYGVFGYYRYIALVLYGEHVYIIM